MRNHFKYKKSRKGYTLIELSVAIALVILIAGTLTSMLIQQTQFLRWWKTQDFIAEEAPMANAMVVRLFAKADGFNIHTTSDTALARTNGVTSGGKAMLLAFTEANGTKRKGIIWFDDVDSLWYGVVNDDDTMPDDNTWKIASGIASANFAVVSSTMQITLTGPYGGQVTYAATPSL